MPKQLELFQGNRRRIQPRDTHVVPEERPRLSGQNGRILEILRHRRASNTELAMISKKYTSRISDIRKAGYDIRVVERDHKTGLTVYQLFD